MIEDTAFLLVFSQTPKLHHHRFSYILHPWTQASYNNEGVGTPARARLYDYFLQFKTIAKTNGECQPAPKTTIINIYIYQHKTY
ncbi:MAG: hypothetical protein AAFW70_05280 [Cyanobacteria bacterium J06635_10]